MTQRIVSGGQAEDRRTGGGDEARRVVAPGGEGGTRRKPGCREKRRREEAWVVMMMKLRAAWEEREVRRAGLGLRATKNGRVGACESDGARAGQRARAATLDNKIRGESGVASTTAWGRRRARCSCVNGCRVRLIASYGYTGTEVRFGEWC